MLLGVVLVASLASPAWAQRGRSAGVNSVYGQFSAAEMQAAGGDPEMAGQLRQQKQMLQYQQQMYKQQQQYLKQNAKQQDFLKKHPEAAKAFSYPARTTKKATTKAGKKEKPTAETTPPPIETGSASNPTTEPKTKKVK